MKQNHIIVAVLTSSILMACSGEKEGVSPTSETKQAVIQKTVDQVSEVEQAKKQLMAKWTGPYQGVPAFDEVSIVGIVAAVEEGMKQNLAEVDVIANNSEPANFENTIVAMERTGELLNRVFNYWGIWSANMSSPEFRKIQAEMAPKLSAFSSKISQNAKLFSRVSAVYNGEEVKSLRADQQRLVLLTYNSFARNGATLNGDAKKRYAQINQRLAELHNKFSNNVLADEESYVLYLTDKQLSGLPQSVINSAESAAKDRDHDGQYAITNTRSSMDPFLTYSTERKLRKQVWETYYNRGDNGDEFDNNAIIVEILKLRHERVGLLGYKNYASWRLEDRMAKSPENAINLMESV